MIQEKEHKEKKPSAMAQVHNKVNAGIMDAVTCGGMCEAAEPEDEEYVIGGENDAPVGGRYYHVNESTDCIPYYNLTLNADNAYPFITFTKKDGTDTETFVGEPGEKHDTMPVKLLSSKKIKKEDFGDSLWDIKRDEYKSGRIWFLENGRIFVSFYSYKRSNYSAMYKDVVETLLQVKEKLGLNFNIGKVIIDFWTFINGDDNIFVPVRWLSNGIADAYFKYMIECVPVGEDSFKLKTARGNFVLDWKGDENESENSMLSEEKEHNFDYRKYIKSFINFLRNQHLKIDPLPEIEFKNNRQEGLFIKTGYYSPDEMKVVVYTDGRHPKDVMRTVAHEMVHHMQNLQDPEKDWGSNGDLEQDKRLRGIEGEAFLLGNIIFREWTEYAKKNERNLNESRTKKKLNDKGETVPEKCDKCCGEVVLQIHGEPVYICKECGKYFGTMPFPGSLDEITSELVEPDDVDLSSFNIKKHLNPKFWDDGHLDTRIRLKLLDIADDFFDSLGVDWVEPEDVIITGSLANYNWNDKYSDIDLHILVDYEDVDERVDFVREYFTLKKNEWNEKHKGLRIFGFPVEVYVQDANEAHASSGVYSIDRDEWITEPDREKIRSGKVNKKHIREMISTYMNKIDCLIDIYKHHKDDKHEMEQVAKDAAEMLDEIKAIRKEDLAKYGREMCDGNIIFKALRRADYIGKLIKLKNLTYDKINSL